MFSRKFSIGARCRLVGAAVAIAAIGGVASPLFAQALEEATGAEATADAEGFSVAEALAAADEQERVFEEPDAVASPSGDIVVKVYADDRGRPTYEVAFRGAPIVAPSRLGFRFKDHAPLDENLTLIGTETFSADETWEQPWGERRLVRDRHNEMIAHFGDSESDLGFYVRFRVFDDGVGFRYELERQRGARLVEIVDELTEFAVGEDATAWWIPARRWNRYEYLYNTTASGEVTTAHTPFTLRTKAGVHMAIHEAALVDYSGMALDQERPGVFKADLAPWSDGVLVKRRAPFSTPWRTIQIAPDAVGLLNSDLILNLNEPNALGDVSFFKPGKYVGVWWAMHIRDKTWGAGPHHGATTEETKRYLDFAAEHGFTGVLVEGWNVGWDGDWFNNGDVFSFTEPYPDFDFKAVTDYAREKGVTLIGHHETSGAVTNYENQLAAALDLYAAHGVNLVKTGYVADAGDIKRIDAKGVPRYEYHDGQFMARHHLRVVREAAARGISVNPHEPIKDTGLRRTYPNWVSREGARGQEFNAWGVPPNSPEHTAILPFTRMLAGPMDFTPGIFDLEPNLRAPVAEDFPRNDPASRVPTTLAKQLALYVVLYSPIQMAADLPENYEKRPDAFQFIKDVPTDWEESVAVAGEIGDFVAFARKARGGEDWYLGAVTDETAREFSAPLTFLDVGRAYTAEIYRDGPRADWKSRPYDIVVERRAVSGGEAFRARLAPGGGLAVRFTPAETISEQ